jgi:hypothetical protein
MTGDEIVFRHLRSIVEAMRGGNQRRLDEVSYRLPRKIKQVNNGLRRGNM